jgi:hypothetical protein
VYHSSQEHRSRTTGSGGDYLLLPSVVWFQVEWIFSTTSWHRILRSSACFCVKVIASGSLAEMHTQMIFSQIPVQELLQDDGLSFLHDGGIIRCFAGAMLL